MSRLMTTLASGRKKGVASLALLATGAALFSNAVVFTPQANAEGLTAGRGYEVPRSSIGTGPGGADTHWAGAFAGPNGGLAWCIEAGAIASAPSPFSGAVDNSQVSAALSLYEGIDSAESRAALALIVHENLDIGTNYVNWINDVVAAHPSVRALANQYWAEAAKYAGAYSVKDGGFTSTDGGRTYTLANVHVESGSNVISGYQITLTIPSSSPAVFDNGQKTITVNSGSNVKVNATGNGRVTVGYAASGLPGNGPLRTYRERAGLQMMAVSAGPSSASGQSREVPLSFNFQPTISSKVASEFVSEGSVVTDNLTVGLDASVNPNWIVLGNGSPVPVTFKGTLYGPYDKPQESLASAIVTPGSRDDFGDPVGGGEIIMTPDPVPDGAPVVATRTVTATKVGDLQAGNDVKVEKSGYYTWVWEVVRSEQPKEYQQYIKGDYSDGFFAAGETTIAKMNPSITTIADDKIVNDGDGLIDKVTLSLTEGGKWITDKSGNPITLTAVGTVYGPFKQPVEQLKDTPIESLPVAGRESITFDSTGTKQTTGSVKAAGEGFYTWVWEIKPGEYNDGYKTDYMIFDETSVNQWEIEHESDAREYNVNPGGRAFDVITISNMPDNHTEFDGTKSGWKADLPTAHVTVYGPMKDAPSTVEVPKNAPVFKKFDVEAKNGTYRIGYDDATRVEVPKTGGEGYYVFVYSFDGDDRVAAYSSAFNDIRERFYVNGPEFPNAPWLKVVTQATSKADTGEPFSDTALVTSNDDKKTLADQGAYLQFDAYLDSDGDDVATCTTPFFTSEKVPVTRSGYYNSGDTTVTEAGNVYWIETLYNKDGKVLSQGECGIPSETTKVTKPAELKVTTQATSAVPFGEKAHDTAIVTGTMPEGGVNLHFDAYEAKKNAAGEAVCEAENKVFSTDYGHIDKVGSYDSEEVTFSKPGDYYWVETVTDKDGNVIHKGDCGLPNETTKVTKMTVTTQASEKVTLGNPAHDTAIVEGDVPSGAILSFEAYKAATGKDGKPVCEADNKVFSTEYGEISKAGKYDSEEVTFKEAGKYYWVETVSDAKGNVIHRGDCGLPNETTTVTEPTPVENLAHTGAAVLPFAAAGLVLVGVAGTAMVARRRRSAEND